MKRIDILLLSDRIVVNPSSRAPAGYWISHGPWTRLSLDADPVTIAEAVKCSLLESRVDRSEEHTSELQSLMRISYAVFCLKKKTKYNTHQSHDRINMLST